MSREQWAFCAMTFTLSKARENMQPAAPRKRTHVKLVMVLLNSWKKDDVHSDWFKPLANTFFNQSENSRKTAKHLASRADGEPLLLNALMITSAKGDQVLFHIITIQFRTTEDYCLVHFMFLDGCHQVLDLQNLHSFGQGFCIIRKCILIMKFILSLIDVSDSLYLDFDRQILCCLLHGFHQSKEKHRLVK